MYHAIRQRARGLVPADLREKYGGKVQAGQALYVDQNFALRQPNTEKYQLPHDAGGAGKVV